MEQEEAAGVTNPLVYLGADEHPIHFANHFVGQHMADIMILILGQVSPPIVFGSGEKQAQQMRDMTYLPVKTVTRVALTRKGTKELIATLQEMLEKFNSQ